MLQIFKTRAFVRWLKKTPLSDQELYHAVLEMQQGLIDAELGGAIVKKRIGLLDRGKRGGARTLIATNKADKWFFIFGFEKNERDNISHNEQTALKVLATDLLSLTTVQLKKAVAVTYLEEVRYET